jgi:hypothetical protein
MAVQVYTWRRVFFSTRGDGTVVDITSIVGTYRYIASPKAIIKGAYESDVVNIDIGTSYTDMCSILW